MSTPTRKSKFGPARGKTIPIATEAKRIKAWSFSRYKDYTQCPLKARLKHVDRLSEPGSAAMERGTAIHKMAEDYARGTLKKLPKELAGFTDFFKLVRKYKDDILATEDNWAFTQQWDPCEWNDWNRAWVRVKIDLVLQDGPGHVMIIDHKTGKRKADHLEQLSLYALAGFVMYPDAKEITSRLTYLDSGEVGEEGFHSKQLTALKKEWTAKAQPMLNDTTFAPRPGNYCRWCHFRKANGGPCQY